MSSVDTSPAPEPAHKKKGAHDWTKGQVYHLEGSETTGELALRAAECSGDHVTCIR